MRRRPARCSLNMVNKPYGLEINRTPSNVGTAYWVGYEGLAGARR